MTAHLVTTLLPVLISRSEDEFNVFDVMRHGTHEKQLSNVFAWLLDADGTHRLGDEFQSIFIDAVNRSLQGGEPIPKGAFGVRQEVNTSQTGAGMDIADLVLEDHETIIVVENYYTSDGHGHSYAGYLALGAREGKRSVGVLLCETEDRSALADGWEEAPVVVYEDVLTALKRRLERDEEYRRSHPDQCAFLDHLERRFVKGRRVNDDNLVDFIDVLCKTGEAGHFRSKNRDDAAIAFGDRLRDEAIDRFQESRELLSRVKRRLRDYGKTTLVHQVNAALGEEFLNDASATYQGIYEWTVNLRGSGEDGKHQVQLKFGPSVWYANEQDEHWTKTVTDPDYSRVFVTWRGEVRQSGVSLQDVLDGIGADDFRLRDEVLGLVHRATGPGMS